jgi:tellurite resistance protein TehA-like permease
LLAIVGTEAPSVLASTFAPVTGAFASAIYLLSHTLWGIGLFLYGIYVVLLHYRLFFFDVKPDDITPALWVVMGAAAISTDAGSAIILAHSGVTLLDAMRPFVIGATLITWAWATLWIPFLLMLGFWKYVVRREPITYTPLVWSAVFPVGMYSMATTRLSIAGDFPILRGVANVVVWIAVTAWVLALGALLAACWRDFHKFTRSGRTDALSSPS